MTWNFHGYIALPLEEYAKQYIGSTCPSADEIETGEFINVMFSVLLAKFGTLNDIRAFVDMCNEYVNLSAQQIPRAKAEEIFDEFKRILKN